MDIPRGEINVRNVRAAVAQGRKHVEEFPEIAFIYEKVPALFDPKKDLTQALEDNRREESR